MPYISKTLLTQLKRDQKEKEEKEAEERKKYDEEVQKRETVKRAKQLAEQLEREERERKERLIKGSETYTQAGQTLEPIQVADEDLFKSRYGLTIQYCNVVDSTAHNSVYKAQSSQPKPDQSLVVKVTTMERCPIPYRNRLKAEALRAIKWLTPLSKGVMPEVIGTFLTGKKAYVFMEELPQPNLYKRIENKPMPVEQVRRLVPQIAQAIRFVHQNAFAHLNIRADNFMLVEKSGQQQVVMVGLSRLFQYWQGEEAKLHEPIKDRFYRDHLPPEVIPAPFDPLPVDVYSLGVLLYHMLTGDKPLRKQQPFNGTEDMEQVWKAHCELKRAQVEGLPADWRQLIESMVAVSKPDQRPSFLKLLQDPLFI